MKKKWMRLAAAFLAAVLCMIPPLSVQATKTIDSLNEKINSESGAIDSAKDEKAALESGLGAAQKKKEQLVEQKHQLSGYVEELDGELNDVVAQLARIEELLTRKEAEIENTAKELEKAKVDVDNQYENMKIRIKFMYERGSVSYLQILLGAGSFSEMLNKAEYIEQLSSYDRKMLVKFQETKVKVAELEEELKEQKVQLVKTREEVAGKQEEMAGLIEKKKNEITDFETDIKNKEQAIAEYEEMIKEQDDLIRALEASVAAAKAERERLKTVSGNSAYPSSYGGGPFAWPAPRYTRISDDYGERIHPTLGVPQFHNGVDMAAPSGTPILAAADGMVIAAAYSNTMGNYVMIDHGSGLYTIYMHASTLGVVQGQIVSRGEQIAAVGSTGRSTGPHLHFSVRLKGSYVSPWGYL